MLSPGELKARLDARVATRLSPIALGVSAIFAFFAAMTVIHHPPGVTVPLLAINGAGAALMAVLGLAFRRVPIPTAYAQPALALVLLVALAASLTGMKLIHLAIQTTNVMLVMIAAASLFLDLRLSFAFFVIALGGWTAVFLTEPVDARWVNALFALVATTVIAGVVQTVRYREATQHEQLLASLDEKTRALEVARRREELQVRDLASANEGLQAFNTVVAHDVKEPIRGIRAYLDAAIEARDAAEREEAMRRAASSAEHFQRLVSGLLEWSRVAAEPLELAPLRVQDLLADPTGRAQFEPLLEERGAELVVDPDIPAVLATAPLLRQALGNLVLNAIRHNPGARPRIHVRAGEAPPGRVAVVVADNGPGFPPPVVQRLASLKNRPSTVRSGFGLSIAHRAVVRMGGELRLANGPEGGEAHVELDAAPGSQAGGRPPGPGPGP